MESQIFLFTGENLYELQRKRTLWIEQFSSKHGAENVTVSDGKTLPFAQCMDEASAAPFIAEKRLLVIDGIPKYDKDQIEALTKALHPQNLILFVDPKPDKRLAACKFVLKIATVETFTKKVGSALLTWMKDIAKKEGATLQDAQARLLLEVVGDDQMLLASEITKIATYAYDREITDEDIHKLAMLSQEQVVWKLLDLLSANKKDEAIAFTHSILKRGEDPFGLWGMFIWMINRITLVSACVQEGMPANVIAKEAGMHPRAVTSMMQLAKTFTPQTLAALAALIAESDIDLKTGAYRHTAESNEEFFALLDTRIAAVASL